MKHDKYILKVDQKFVTFQFTSRGPKGKIIKQIMFVETNTVGYFNLSFGDIKKNTNTIDDTVNSNNGDLKKVIATIISAINLFTMKYESAWIYFEGSDQVRTRLYKIVISLNLEIFTKEFYIYGFYKGDWQLFTRDKDFEAFLIRKKNVNLKYETFS